MLPLHEQRLCRCTEHTGEESWHGRSSGAGRHRCACDLCREYKRRRSAAYRSVNPERVRQWNRKWRLENPDSLRAYSATYRGQNGLALAAKNGRQRERYSTLTSPGAVRQNSKWTRSEDVLALREDMTMMEIAALIGRTHEAVMKHRHHLRKATANA